MVQALGLPRPPHCASHAFPALLTVRPTPSHTAELWTAPDLLRADVDYSSAPFPGPVPQGFGPGSSSFLQNFTSGEAWSWVTLAGQTFCQKNAFSGTSAVCIGANLALNGSHIAGGSPVYSWVGFEPASADNQGDCWHELLINSVEETDPARWLSATSQCTRPAAKGGYPRYSVEAISFWDFSTEPFPPSVFELPKECQQ